MKLFVFMLSMFCLLVFTSCDKEIQEDEVSGKDNLKHIILLDVTGSMEGLKYENGWKKDANAKDIWKDVKVALIDLIMQFPDTTQMELYTFAEDISQPYFFDFPWDMVKAENTITNLPEPRGKQTYTYKALYKLIDSTEEDKEKRKAVELNLFTDGISTDKDYTMDQIVKKFKLNENYFNGRIKFWSLGFEMHGNEAIEPIHVVDVKKMSTAKIYFK